MNRLGAFAGMSCFTQECMCEDLEEEFYYIELGVSGASLIDVEVAVYCVFRSRPGLAGSAARIGVFVDCSG